MPQYPSAQQRLHLPGDLLHKRARYPNPAHHTINGGVLDKDETESNGHLGGKQMVSRTLFVSALFMLFGGMQ